MFAGWMKPRNWFEGIHSGRSFRAVEKEVYGFAFKFMACFAAVVLVGIAYASGGLAY
jgi:hypothetical protein